MTRNTDTWKRLQALGKVLVRSSLPVMAVGLTLMVGSCLCNSEQTKSSDDLSRPSARPILNLAIWSNYINDETLRRFEQHTGIKVNVSNFSSNEELLAKMQAGHSGYDLIVPSDYMVATMRALKLLQPIESHLVQGAARLDPAMMDKPYDRHNEYSLPYCWTVTGIAINVNMVKSPPRSWKAFFRMSDLTQRVSWLDDPREMVGAALKAHRKSLNDVTDESLASARATLLGARKSVKTITSEPLDGLLSGELWVAAAFSSDVLQARAESEGAVDFVIPSDGGTLAIDNFAIPTAAKHVDAARRFINFVYQPDIYLGFIERVRAGSVMTGVMERLPPKLQADPVLNPPASVRSRLEMMNDIGERMPLVDRIWTEVKVSG